MIKGFPIFPFALLSLMGALSGSAIYSAINTPSPSWAVTAGVITIQTVLAVIVFSVFISRDHQTRRKG